MRILGIDPGATTGWVIYHDAGTGRFVEACGEFRGDDMLSSMPGRFWSVDAAVIERPVAHGATRPQVVDCAWIAGCLWRDLWAMVGCDKCHTVTRLEVRQALTAAVHKVVSVRDDKTAWAALTLIHGDGSDRKPRTRKGVVIEDGGCIGRTTGHARAALAAAVAWRLLHP